MSFDPQKALDKHLSEEQQAEVAQIKNALDNGDADVTDAYRLGVLFFATLEYEYRKEQDMKVHRAGPRIKPHWSLDVLGGVSFNQWMKQQFPKIGDALDNASKEERNEILSGLSEKAVEQDKVRITKTLWMYAPEQEEDTDEEEENEPSVAEKVLASI